MPPPRLLAKSINQYKNILCWGETLHMYIDRAGRQRKRKGGEGGAMTVGVLS